jgi:hypothetical protein
MKFAILITIIILFDSICAHADPAQKSIEVLIQNWDTEAAREFSKEKIRAASIALEYDRTVSLLESTRELIGAVKGDPEKIKITYSVSQSYQWSSPRIEVYFTFVLCELVGVNAHALMYYTKTDESNLEELVGVLFFGARPAGKASGG